MFEHEAADWELQRLWLHRGGRRGAGRVSGVGGGDAALADVVVLCDDSLRASASVVSS